MTNVFSLPISKIAEKIRKSEITCLELCQNYISQIEKYEKDVKAWAFFDKKLLIEKPKRLTHIENLENPWVYCMVFL